MYHFCAYMYHSPFSVFSIPDGKRSSAAFDKGILIHAPRVCALRGFACLAADNRGKGQQSCPTQFPYGLAPYPEAKPASLCGHLRSDKG